MSFLWPGVISRASVPRGTATLIFHASGVDLSEASLGHRYQLSPKCKPEAFRSSPRVSPSTFRLALMLLCLLRALCRLSNGIPCGSVVKNLPCRGRGFRPWAGRSPGERNGNPLQYSCLGNPMDRGAWQGSWRQPGVCKESGTTEQARMPAIHDCLPT